MEEKIINILGKIDNEIVDIEYDRDLLESGIIDSLQIFNLISNIEKEFNIIVEGDEIIEENFSTINNIIQYVKRKL